MESISIKNPLFLFYPFIVSLLSLLVFLSP